MELLEPLFAWMAAGGLVEAHKVDFERWIWETIGVPQHGFPHLRPDRLACSMATARVNTLPGGLDMLGSVLQLPVQKDKEGTRLINKFSVPNKPTKKRTGFWVMPQDDPEDFERFHSYCRLDVKTEVSASTTMPPMTAMEREFWLEDQEINWRGIAIDRAAVRDCIAILGQVLELRGREFTEITGVKVTELAQFKGWLAAQGVYVDSLDQEHLEELLQHDNLPTVAREALEIRALIGSASVKKIYAMDNMASDLDRLHNLIIHHGARTGRPTGEGPQPLNLPKAGPQLITCGGCASPFHPKHISCPWCGQLRPPPALERERRLAPTWRPEMVQCVLEVMATRRLSVVEFFFGDAVQVIMGLCAASLSPAPACTWWRATIAQSRPW